MDFSTSPQTASAILARISPVANTWTALQTFTAGLTVSAGTTALQAVTCTTLTASSTFTLIDRSALYPTTFGYSSAYKVVRIGNIGTYDTSALTVAIGVNPTTVAGGTFTGNGSEILLGRGMRLLQPNSGGTDWEYASLSVGDITCANGTFTGTTPGTAPAGQVLIGGGEINAAGGVTCASLAASGTITAGASSTVTQSLSGTLLLTVQNTDGVSSGARTFLRVNNSDASAQLNAGVHNAGYSGTIFGTARANDIEFLASGASLSRLVLGVSGVDKPISFGINASEVAQFTGGVLSTGSLAVKYTTPSTSTTTGALVVSGGLGVAGAGFFGGGLTCTALTASSPTSGIGYATGAGGAVTQGTSRTTGVAINTVVGAITLFSAAGSTTEASFTVTNSAVAATDVIHLAQKTGANKYVLLVTAVAAGSFQVTQYTTGGTATEAPVINFAVIKGVTA